MFQSHQIAYMREHVRVREARPLNFLRESVAYLLSAQARKVPHAAGIASFDVTPVYEYAKEKYLGRREHCEGTPSEDLVSRSIFRNFSGFFLKAFANVLHHVPEMNGFIDYAPFRKRGTLYLAEDINVSFTVHTKYGVIRPIVRNPHLKSLTDVADEMRVLTRKARRTDMNRLYEQCAQVYLGTAFRQLDPSAWLMGLGWLRYRLFSKASRADDFAEIDPGMKLAPEDVMGATCTLANIGSAVNAYQTVTVIIPPEVTMLGIGNVELQPRVIDGEIVPRHMVNTCVTLDHRALDGGDVFAYAKQMARYLENPGLVYDYEPGDPIP